MGNNKPRKTMTEEFADYIQSCYEGNLPLPEKRYGEVKQAFFCGAMVMGRVYGEISSNTSQTLEQNARDIGEVFKEVVDVNIERTEFLLKRAAQNFKDLRK